MRSSKSIVIVGGGVSGLIAGATLVSAGGYSVTLLEADNHIGGRVKSRKFGKNYVEFGAEWVHGEKDNRVFEVMEPLGVLVNEPLGDTELDGTSALFEGLVFATQEGEIMELDFNQKVGEIFNKIQEGNSEDDDSSSEDQKLQSLGDYATQVFEDIIEESPVHEKDSINNAALDFIHRYFNVLDSADTWFQTSHSDTGDQFEYCEGNRLVGWKLPATFSSLLRVILGQSPTETSEIVLPNWIQLGKEVTEIIYSTTDDSLVTVVCKDGTVYKADHVLTTVSLGVLKQSHATLFIPNLSSQKQLAIENLGFGTANKIYLEFETPWWEVENEGFLGVGFLWDDKDNETINANWLAESSDEDLLEEHDGVPVWCRSLIAFNIVNSQNHPAILQGWISGVSSRFMETLDMDYVTEACTNLLRKFLKNRFSDIPDPIESARSTWNSNPFTRGSYSFRTVDAEKSDVWARDLETPVLDERNKPILTFAGEATHSKYYSTVNGAYDTGVREAQRILDYYGKN